MLTPTAAQEEEPEKMWNSSQHQLSEDKSDELLDPMAETTNGILAFVSLNSLVRLFIDLMRRFKTGLLSATITAFIIESYKTLSPDSGGQTVTLLGQISQQLTNSRNGTSITAANQPFSPSVYMIWVNAMWLISLVFSITSALIAILNQQAVRRYVEIPKEPRKPSDRARVRLLLSRGMTLYRMPLVIFAAPMLLHLSIWLFFGGLVIVFHNICEKVAIALDIAVGFSGLAYMVMTLLPLLDFKSPYRTPFTYLLWGLWHAFLSFAAYCGLLLFARRLPGCSCLCPCLCSLLPHDSDGSDKPDSSDGAGSGEQYILEGSNSLGNAVEERRRYLMDGFPKSVINGATDPPEDEGRKTITWLFRRLSLGDKNKFLEFAAGMPRLKVIDLIPIKSGKFVLRQPLLVLLQSCTDDTGALGLGEDVRKAALSTCLTAINDIAKAPTIPDLNFVQGEFADINRMRVLWNDNNNSICINSRSICALVARQIVRKRRLEDADLGWLQEVTGEPPNAILEANVAALDQMNFKSFVYGALPPNHANHLSTEDATSFNETLAILLDVRTDSSIYFTTPDWQTRLSEEVGRIQQYDPEGGRELFDRLHSIFPSLSAAPSIYREAPSFDAEALFPREAPFVHHERPSSPVVPSPPAPRPRRRAARFYQVTRPPQTTPPPHTPPSPSVASSPRAAPPSPVLPSPPASAPRPCDVAHSSQVTRPPVATPSPRAPSPGPSHVPSPPRAAPSPHAVSYPPGRAIPPPRDVFPLCAPPPPRATPSPSPLLPPSVPATPRAASPPRTARRSRTARPPHAPV
jgi:hypothetical protein